MNERPLDASQYPIAETAADQISGIRGRSLNELTLEAIAKYEVVIEDVGITPHTLLLQAKIAHAAGRQALAENFARAAEMARLPQDEVLQIYELLRPGRAVSAEAIECAACRMETELASPRLAAFLREAATNYVRRGLFQRRF